MAHLSDPDTSKVLLKNPLFPLLIGSVFLLLLETGAYLKNSLCVLLASRIWLAGWLACAAAILILYGRQVLTDIKAKRWLPLLFQIFLGLLLASSLSGPTRGVIGQDATQQLAAGLQALKQTDWNYTGTAFLGYPSRQYLLAALPSWLFGRSELSLQIGFAYPFYLGLMVFQLGLRRWAAGLRHGDLAALAATSALLVFPYVTEYYLYFEHTLFPVCFSLQAIGWLLLLLRRPLPGYILALIWTGAMLVFCYTPALAAAGLLIGVLGLTGLFGLAGLAGLSRRAEQGTDQCLPATRAGRPVAQWQAWSCLLVAGTIAAYAVLSFTFGRADRATLLRSADIREILAAALTGYQIALTNHPANYAGFYLPFVLVYLLAALTGRLKWLHAMVAVWILAVIGLSQILQGYAVYPPAISFSRTLITVPVLVSAFFLLGCGWLEKLEKDGETVGTVGWQRFAGWLRRPAGRRGLLSGSGLLSALLLALICLNLATGAYNLLRPVVQGDAAKYFNPATLQPMRLLVSDINRTAAAAGIRTDEAFNLVIWTDTVWLKNPRDYTAYFYPAARVIVLGGGDPLPADFNWNSRSLIYFEPGLAIDARISSLAGVTTGQYQLRDRSLFLISRVLIRP